MMERKQQEKTKAVEEDVTNKADFFKSLDKSNDLADNLPALVNFL